MRDTYLIKYDETLEKYVVSINGKQMMKNAKISTVTKTLQKWFLSQGR